MYPFVAILVVASKETLSASCVPRFQILMEGGLSCDSMTVLAIPLPSELYIWLYTNNYVMHECCQDFTCKHTSV